MLSLRKKNENILAYYNMKVNFNLFIFKRVIKFTCKK